MKITILVTIIVLSVLFFIFQGSAKIDMWEESPTSHTFGWWSNGYTKYSRQPDKTLLLPIINGNYTHNPSPTKFAQYLAICAVDTSIMNIDGYNKFMLSR